MSKKHIVTPLDVYAGYPDADLLPIAPPPRGKAADFVETINRERVGDGLFVFLVNELASPNDSLDIDEAERRIDTAIRDLEAVQNHLHNLRDLHRRKKEPVPA